MFDVFRICFCNIKKWTINPRVYLIPIILLIFTHLALSPVAFFSRTVDIAVSPWSLPFIMADSYLVFLFFSALIILFCDAPFISQEHTFMLIRAGKTKFFISQVLYIFIAGALFVFVLFGMSFIVLNNISFTNQWGKIWGTLAQTNAAAQFRIPLIIYHKIIIDYKPIEATLLCALLTWLVSVFLGLLMCLLNSIMNRFIGTVCAAALVLLQWGASFFFGRNSLYFSPVSWTNLNTIDKAGLTGYPSIAYVVTFLCVAIAVLSFLIVFVNRKQEIKIYAQI